MPELPEVESLRRSLEPLIQGQTIRSVEVRDPKLISGRGHRRSATSETVQEFDQGVAGERILAIERRSKQLVFQLTSEKILLSHLKMTGQFVYQAYTSESPTWGGHPIELTEYELPHKHSHILFYLDEGLLAYNDVRKFGYVIYYPSRAMGENAQMFDGLGPEPLGDEFTSHAFRTGLRQTSKSLKAIFLDGNLVTGLGNIYADEVCFRAGLHPQRAGKTLSTEECMRLYTAIREIVTRAIEMGGSSVANYILADGRRGTYAREHKVYNRGGQPCYVCQNTLRKITVAQRTTVFCPSCQI